MSARPFLVQRKFLNLPHRGCRNRRRLGYISHRGSSSSNHTFHFGILFAHTHCAIRAIVKGVFLKGRTTGAYALHHRVLTKWNFHGIRLQNANVRRLIMPLFVRPTWGVCSRSTVSGSIIKGTSKHEVRASCSTEVVNH